MASEPVIAFPGDEWPTADPAAVGMDARRIEEAMAYLDAQCGEDGVRQALVARHGRVVWQGDDVGNVHNVWSCTKVFTSTCLGLLVADGRCTLDTRACEFVPALARHYPEVTLRHLATMTSGYCAVGDDPALGHGQSRTPLHPARPLFAPGSRFLYWDSAMNQFAHVLTRIAGEPLAELFRRRVAEPIGMREWRWETLEPVDGLAVVGGAGNMSKGVHVSARDLARLGLLFLNGGGWRGRRIVSEEWVRLATTPQVPATLPAHDPATEGPGLYGLNWWANGLRRDGSRFWPEAPEATFHASGFNNNRLIAVPEWDLLVVRLGMDGSVDDAHYGRFLGMLGSALDGTAERGG